MSFTFNIVLILFRDKKTIEEVLSALAFLRNVKKHQVPELTENDMNVKREIDFCEETVKAYSSFSKTLTSLA